MSETETLTRVTDDGYLNVSGASKFTGLSESYLNRLRTEGGGPSFCKLGSRVVYALRDLEAWLQQHKRTSTSDTGDRG